MKIWNVLVIAILLAALVGCLKFKRDQLFTPQSFDGDLSELNEIIEEAEEEPKEPEVIESSLGPLKSQDQQVNLKSMVDVLFLYSLPDKKLSTLLAYLTQSEQSPFMVQDAEVGLDGLIIVRTQKPFTGTRYFHAQYFYNENRAPYLQHMSFEFRPGSDSMQRAVEAISSHTERVGEPYMRTDDFVAWRLEPPLQIYVKRLDCMDLEFHPYNAYSQRDIGTIKIAVEIDPHLEGLEGEDLKAALSEEHPSFPSEDLFADECELPSGAY